MKLYQLLALTLILLVGFAAFFLSQDVQTASKLDNVTQTQSLTSLTINARFYQHSKPYLKAGDIVAISAAHPDGTTLTKDSPKFVEALAVLDSINEAELGVSKEISFSSVEDAKNLISLLPSDIVTISYNFEPGMTPQSERNNPVESVKAFSQIVKDSGREVKFGPSHQILRKLIDQDLLKELLPVIDGLGLQAQAVLDYEGTDGLLASVNTVQSYIAKQSTIKPVIVQFWLDRNSSDEVVRSINLLKPSISDFVVYALDNEEGTIEVLKSRV